MSTLATPVKTSTASKSKVPAVKKVAPAAKKTVATTVKTAQAQAQAKPPRKAKLAEKPMTPPVAPKVAVVAAKKMPEKQASTVVATSTVKPLKDKKVKLVRDSFTIPKPEYMVLDHLKLRATELKHPVKKGELLRAGIKALAAMTNAQLLIALKAVPTLKTGRPSK